MTAHLSSRINPLHFGARTSVARSFCVIYQDSDLIVGVYSARFASGCVQLAILSYNAHANLVLPW